MLIKWGNRKIGQDTMIFNMGTAQDCPSKQLGLCKLSEKGIICYAENAEIQYKQAVINYRERQKHDWQSKSSFEILSEFISKIKSRRTETLYIRFNESGDFYSQNDIEKLNYIADGLRDLEPPIITYGYTARSDLDFRAIRFLCKGSGFDSEGLSGTTIVILKDELVPEGYIECPGSCKKCNLCKCNLKLNIAFRKH